MKRRLCGIYKITSPTNKIYIGQSVNIGERERYYKGLFCTGQPRLYRSLKKYGWGRHKFEVIHQCSVDELNKLEIYYITLYNTFNSEYGLNLKEGGANGSPSTETRKKMADACRIRPIKEETILKLRLANLGKKHSDEAKEKMRNARLGKSPSVETRIKMSNSHRRTQSLESREKISKSRIGIVFSEAHKEKLRIAARNRKRHIKQ